MDQPADAPLDADRIVAEATQLFLRRCGLLVDEDEKQ
jgi:hypothetical protein